MILWQTSSHSRSSAMIFWAFLARAPVRATVNKLDDVRVLNLTKLLKMNDCGSGHHPAAGKLKYLHLNLQDK